MKDKTYSLITPLRGHVGGEEPVCLYNSLEFFADVKFQYETKSKMRFKVFPLLNNITGRVLFPLPHPVVVPGSYRLLLRLML